jgi:dipeptidyl-peptidase 4
LRDAPLIPTPTEFFQIDIGGGVVMDAWMLKPKDFDETKKYPVFVFICGEPHAQTVLDDWAGGQNHTMSHRTVADLGDLVVSMGNRGTPAPKGVADEQAAGVKELGRLRSYVDTSRVGIWGWSGAGRTP